MTADAHEGRCLCGATSFLFEGAPRWCVVCHCDSCRRNAGGPMAAWLAPPEGALRWTGAEPAVYRSDAGAERGFCARCGSTLSFRSTALTGILHVSATAMDRPEDFPPDRHVAIEEQLSWLHLGNTLPRRRGPRS